MRVLQSVLTVVVGVTLSAAACGIVFVGLPLGLAMLSETDSLPLTAEEEALQQERDWRRQREMAAWRARVTKTLRELEEWERWQDGEPGLDQSRGEWLTWLEAEPTVTADDPAVQILGRAADG